MHTKYQYYFNAKVSRPIVSLLTVQLWWFHGKFLDLFQIILRNAGSECFLAYLINEGKQKKESYMWWGIFFCSQVCSYLVGESGAHWDTGYIGTKALQFVSLEIISLCHMRHDLILTHQPCFCKLV